MPADEQSPESVPVIAVTAAVGAVVLLLVLLCNMGRQKQEEEREEEEQEEKAEHISEPQKTSKRREQRAAGRSKKEQKATFSHPWLSCSLKSHSQPVLDMDFSANGKFLASCAEDRTVVVWGIKELDKKEHKGHRVNVELDHATLVKFSPDSKAIVLNLFAANAIRVMKLARKSDGGLGNAEASFDFKQHHKEEINCIGISGNGRFIMTCAKDTSIVIWDLKGEILAQIDTRQMNNSHAAVSPCGRFVGSCGFTPDVKIWEICFDKSGAFKEVTRAFELKGHQAGVYSFAFSDGSNRMATVSKDGTWKFWKTDVEYKKQQDPYLLLTVPYTHNGHYSRIALSPDARTVAIATGVDIALFNTVNGDQSATLSSVHSSPITCLLFDPTNHFLLSTGDKHIHVVRNVAGYQSAILDLNEKVQKANGEAMKERIRQQIKQYRDLLSTYENGSTS
ncbi:hypothetical protein CAPTEDRAFT_149780 [Capitella teleta]|uniref:Uncharacterized protein n=1 Tax=Capitella teleta TaxID=283909 RepID=R7U0M7_CAPTE|nr:hypothetical protein CAPTEDRAFT_149780 [Capitella teleta]|eukprot:ELT99402.1 hypothetical protein CAPTEDRAFT_149780 [Capitella teleta]